LFDVVAVVVAAVVAGNSSFVAAADSTLGTVVVAVEDGNGSCFEES
jgi:hypothetical protein